MIFWRKELFRNNHIINSAVCKRLNLCGINITVKINALSLLCKYNWYMEILCYNTGYTDTARFNCEDLIDWTTLIQSLKFFSHL